MKKNKLKLFLVLVAICIPLAANAQPKHIAGPWIFTDIHPRAMRLFRRVR